VAFQMQQVRLSITQHSMTTKLASTLQDYPSIASQTAQNKYNRLSRTHDSITTVITGVCSLYEMIDDEVLNSVVTFSDNGELYFIEASQRDNLQGISGSWSVVNSSLRMVVDRTFKGRLSGYTVRSHYVSLREEPGRGIRTIAGEIFDENMSESNDGPTGQFMISLLTDVDKN